QGSAGRERKRVCLPPRTREKFNEGIERDCLSNSHVFGLWEEAGVPGKNPCMQEENMQTPFRKTPDRDSNPEPSCCNAWLTTAPQCNFSFTIDYWEANTSSANPHFPHFPLTLLSSLSPL
ncbi:hypothetical protein ILYODFUR_022185, partial [Ilyodon furcidens]